MNEDDVGFLALLMLSAGLLWFVPLLGLPAMLMVLACWHLVGTLED